VVSPMSRRSRPAPLSLTLSLSLSLSLSFFLARLTLYCGRIYEIRGDDIPPSTYARTCRALLRRESRRRFNMVNLLDLSACPYLPRPPLLAPGSSYLRHASSTNRQPAQDVAFRFVPPPPPGRNHLRQCVYTAIVKQSIPRDNVPEL